MSTSLAHKIALGPTLEQRQFFEQAAGVSRFTYNWALAEWQERYQLGGKPKEHLLKKSFNALRRVQFPLQDGQDGALFRRAAVCLQCVWLPRRSRSQRGQKHPPTRAGSARSDACGEPSAGTDSDWYETQLVEAGTNPCALSRTRKIAEDGTYYAY